MLYIFNENIVYDDAQCSLTNCKSYDSILLPATASRLLSLFIRYQGSTLTREEILNCVWDEYGYKASNNTLTQYVSLIRKNFQLLGETADIIITIPRTGFVMNKEVAVKMIESGAEKQDILLSDTRPFNDDFLPEKVEQVMSVSDTDPGAEEDSTSAITKKSKRLVWFHGLNALSLFMFFLICYHIQLKTNEMKVSKVYQVGTIDTCPVYMFFRSAHELLPVRLTLTEKIAREKIPCLTGSFYISQQEDSLIFDEAGRLFISRCSYQAGNKKKISSCKSVFSHE
ncbi:winged helix-turn-helix domain-containing protein [Pseudenterobacter timonensis]|uniref:Winged helix-turn-helix domain-containing protein n=1 Tax=Pseudenterobacter timonensis TaxID=1755099 RepID=A0AAE4DJV9_9ENTR|nr:winged helix-turn-helix domain-containing protein [Pseudenterobacter timonensis]MDR9889168.1 winged helix-turn-helix domain-containing protein [Pseudenterobacter timonensis]